jgi:hypothetical protein
MQIFIGRFLPIDCVAETVANLAMQLFQRLAIDKNQLDINSASVTARSIIWCNKDELLG